MTKEEKTFRFSQSGVHDNPDFALEFLREIELLAENVIAERREIVELNKRRDKLREASRALQKQKSNVRNNWLCLNNNFLEIPTKDCTKMIDRDFDRINEEIIRAEKKLKENVKKLYDAEKRPEIRGFELKSLSADERKQLDNLFETFS